MIKTIVTGGTMQQAEIDKYIEYVCEKEKNRGEVETLEIHIEGDFVDLKWYMNPMNFERLRRITGYLVPGLERWNNAKQAEEKDRVKHI